MSSGSAPAPAASPFWKRFFERPGRDRTLVIAALVLLGASLDTGLSADDYVHELIARGSREIPGFAREPWDLYRFADLPYTAELMRDGVLTWWEDPEAKLAFFRPLSALTHMLDNALWPKSGALMHLHSILWAALLYAGLLVLYRALPVSPFVATLATFLYVFDDARGWIGSWVAARNAVIATALSVWVLVLHHRARKRAERRSAFLAPILLLLALLAGEGSIAICGYLFAYALCLERGAPRARVLSLVPYAFVVVPWRVVWHGLGYGVANSGLYFDPITDPLGYLGAVIERAPVLLSSQLGGPWSDIWNILFAFPAIQAVLYTVACSFVPWVVYALWPVVRGDPVVRFGALGALLALLPACAAFPADRLLTWVAIGGALALARLFAVYAEEPATLLGSPARRALVPPLVLLLLVLKLVIEPPFVISRARGNLVLRNSLDRAQATVPMDASITDKRIVFVNPPAFPLAGYVPIERAAQGLPRAASQVVLATGEADLRYTRLDARTLGVRQRGGFLQSPGSHLFRNPRRPYVRGTSVDLDWVDIRVTDFTADGRPAEIRARFDQPLEHAAFVFLAWQGLGYVPFTPPALGRDVTLPALDLALMLLGYPLPIDGRMPAPEDPSFER